MNTNSIDEMKRFIIEFSRKYNLDTGHAIPEGAFRLQAMKLNPKQQEALIPALESLVNDGVFEEREKGFFLTSVGRDVLYP